MKEFFFHLLQNLDKLSGLKQYEKLLQTANPKEEIKTLLDILCRVTDQFPYIPDEDKKRIISDAVINDQEFIGLNAKIVSKWMNQRKDHYFQELAHQQKAPEHEPLTGEARQKKLEEFLAAVNKVDVNFTNKVDMYKEVRERWGPKDGETYTPTVNEQMLYEKERHLQYIQRNYDAKTAQKLPDWIPEQEFNKLYDEGLI
jgi:hypothetical protein